MASFILNMIWKSDNLSKMEKNLICNRFYKAPSLPLIWLNWEQPEHGKSAKDASGRLILIRPFRVAIEVSGGTSLDSVPLGGFLETL